MTDGGGGGRRERERVGPKEREEGEDRKEDGRKLATAEQVWREFPSLPRNKPDYCGVGRGGGEANLLCL